MQLDKKEFLKRKEERQAEKNAKYIERQKALIQRKEQYDARMKSKEKSQKTVWSGINGCPVCVPCYDRKARKYN